MATTPLFVIRDSSFALRHLHVAIVAACRATRPPEQVTPYQVHGVVVTSQPERLAQLDPSVLLYNASRARHSTHGISLTPEQKSAGVVGVGVDVGVGVAVELSVRVDVGVAVSVGVGVSG